MKDSDEMLELALRVEKAIAQIDKLPIYRAAPERWMAAVAEWRDCVQRHGPGSMSATGALLGCARIATGIKTLTVAKQGDSWMLLSSKDVWMNLDDCVSWGSEYEALVVALESLIPRVHHIDKRDPRRLTVDTSHFLLMRIIEILAIKDKDSHWRGFKTTTPDDMSFQLARLDLIERFGTKSMTILIFERFGESVTQDAESSEIIDL